MDKVEVDRDKRNKDKCDKQTMLTKTKGTNVPIGSCHERKFIFFIAFVLSLLTLVHFGNCPY